MAQRPASWLRPMSDTALVGFVALTGAVSFDRDSPQAFMAQAGLAGLVVALIMRRRWPVGALLVGLTAYTVGVSSLAMARELALLAVLVLLFTVAASQRDAGWVRASSLALTALTVGSVTVAVERSVAPRAVPTAVIGVEMAYVWVAWGVGGLIRSADLQRADLRRQVGDLQLEREEVARHAVTAERVRVARELHDVLARHVSVMSIQAAAARRIMSNRPSKVPEILETIETAGREAVAELQRLLGLLRDGGEEGTPTRQPTLSQLPDLVRELSGAGLDIELDIREDGASVPVPAGIEVSAYRTVEEALTNTLKHAGSGVGVVVSICQRRSSLEIIVRDDGRGTLHGDALRDGVGKGIVGLRERIHSHGGELRAGRRTGGGYEVRAWFPLAASNGSART